MNKKYISLTIIMCLLATMLLSGCDDNEDQKENAEDTARTAILKEFSNISEVPRNNGDDMSRISKYIVDRADELKLKSTTDDAGNIMIEKPATEGYESSPTTILHSNMDMITKSNSSIVFDETKDAITPIINETTGNVTGSNTSLGASSGLGMATIFFVLENSTANGLIKAIFTVDGEGGMDGARNIDKKFLEGDYMINLNNTDNKNIETGSACSSVLTCSEKITKVNTKNKYSFVLVADGFEGSDSGIGAQSGLGNPIMFLAEVLALAKSEGLVYELNDFNSGNKASNIPERATATITVNEYEKSRIASVFNKVKKNYLKKHVETDPDAKLEIIDTTVPDKALNDNDAGYLISFLYGIVDGKYGDADKTTASSNVGTVKISKNKVTCKIFVQSKLESARDKMIDDHTQIAKISNMTIKVNDVVSGFNTDSDAYLPTSLDKIYSDDIDTDVNIGYRTTRTELGFFQEKNPALQIVSIGPTIENDGEINEYVKLKTIDTPFTAVLSFLNGLNK